MAAGDPSELDFKAPEPQGAAPGFGEQGAGGCGEGALEGGIAMQFHR